MNTATAIYVHLPWCVRKCPYCDFNSHAAPGRIPELTYVKALLADLDADLDLAADRTVTSVFLGGGTPSLFGTVAIETLLKGIATRLSFAADVEITMEANPGTIEHGRFEGYAAAGVNRVSLGAQSFDAERLKQLGRIHGPEEIGIAVSELRAASITNFNLDLMYALPEQTTAGALADLSSAIALGPAHLSHYQLTLEPGTAFYYRPPPLPDDDQAFEMQEGCQQMLAAVGFEQYEVSAYSRPARQCRHNLNYWRYGDYLGIGAGAHGKVTVDGQVIRTEKPRMPREYLRRAVEGMDNGDTRRSVPVADLPFEFMLNALRLHEGFTLADFERATGLGADSLEPGLADLAARTLMAETGGRWRPTGLGFRFLNDLQAAFLPPGEGVAGSRELYTAPSRLGPERHFRHIVTDVP
ncbi:MAG: oxygen-independent coproporphyrinogen oxidase [Steroidobacteraceae bacterium]|nr:oxygen-independent coproporphyrinogen oxidase [Steroidobacteraceae bacterium]